LESQPSSRTGENPSYGLIGGDRGNVGIIRSPIRASILPDYSWVKTGKAQNEHMFSGLPPIAI